MRILLVNRTFWPEPVSAGIILSELAADLGREHEVTVIAGPSPISNGNGRRGLFCREQLGRVEALRTWGTRFPRARLPGRLLNLGSYFVLAAVAGLRMVERPDVVIANTDPPLLGLLGAWLKRRHGCKFVYYCWDIYPDIAVATGGLKNRALLRLLEYANRSAYASADRIVVLGRDMARRLEEKGVAPEKLAIIPQWVDCQRFRTAVHEPLPFDPAGRFVLMYFGNFGLTQPLETVLEAAERLREDGRFLFVLIGEGVRKAALESQARARRLSNVCFLPYPSVKSSARLLAAADLHIIPWQRGLAGLQLPYKLYGILAAARPFVALMEDHTEIAQLARSFKVGLVVAPGNVGELVRAIGQVAADPESFRLMGERGRRLAEQKFDRKLVTRRFGDLLAELHDLSNCA